MKITNFNFGMVKDGKRLDQGKNPYTLVYLLNSSKVFKLLKRPYSNNMAVLSSYHRFRVNFNSKLALAEKLRHNQSLILPDEICVDKNNQINGFSYEYVDLPDLTSFFNESQDIESITELYILIASLVEKLYSDGVIAPDLINKGNILYNPKSKAVKFIDYDGLQIDSVQSNSISKTLMYRQNPVLSQAKYRNHHNLFTKEINTMSLLIGYLEAVTGINVASLAIFQKIMYYEQNGKMDEKRKQFIGEVFHNVGIFDEEVINGYTNLFSAVEPNPAPLPIIKKISLEPSLKQKSFTK